MNGICEQIKKDGKKCTYIAKWKVKLNNEQDYNKLMCGIHSKNKEKTMIIKDKANSRKDEKIIEDNKDKIEIILSNKIIQFENNVFDKLNYDIVKNKRTYTLKYNKEDLYIKLYINSSFSVNKGKYKNYIILKNDLLFEFIEVIQEYIQEYIEEKKINLCKYNFSPVIKYNDNNNKYIILYIDNNFIKCKQYKNGILYINLNKLWVKKEKYGVYCNITNIYSF